jgi:hypothetical protein
MPSSDRRRTIVPGAAALRAVPPALAAWLLSAATALAESPSPTQGSVGDPRSSGAGPGLVGDPLFAIGIVVLIALVSLAATLAYVRVTGGRRGA